jgi:hypothetical protein
MLLGAMSSGKLFIRIRVIIMTEHEWVKEFPGNIEVCDRVGNLLEMNDRAVKEYGIEVIGRNILGCHPEPARMKLKTMLESGQANVYTIRENGAKILVYQTPWYQNGKYAGFVELCLEIPEELPHQVNDK